MEISKERLKQLVRYVVDEWKPGAAKAPLYSRTLDQIIDRAVEKEISEGEGTIKPLNKVIAIKEIMNNFDFKRVVTTMEALDWRWASLGKVPDLAEVKIFALDMLGEVCFSDENSRVSSGGFVAEFHEEEQMLTLDFIVSEWEYYTE